MKQVGGHRPARESYGGGRGGDQGGVGRRLVEYHCGGCFWPTDLLGWAARGVQWWLRWSRDHHYMPCSSQWARGDVRGCFGLVLPSQHLAYVLHHLGWRPCLLLHTVLTPHPSSQQHTQAVSDVQLPIPLPSCLLRLFKTQQHLQVVRTNGIRTCTVHMKDAEGVHQVGMGKGPGGCWGSGIQGAGHSMWGFLGPLGDGQRLATPAWFLVL